MVDHFGMVIGIGMVEIGMVEIGMVRRYGDSVHVHMTARSLSLAYKLQVPCFAESVNRILYGGSGDVGSSRNRAEAREGFSCLVVGELSDSLQDLVLRRGQADDCVDVFSEPVLCHFYSPFPKQNGPRHPG